MRVRVLTLRYSSSLGGFDDRDLRDFLIGIDVHSFREHFFVADEVPHIACVVVWREQDADRTDGSDPTGVLCKNKKPKFQCADPAASLDDQQRRLFDDLRTWRRERSQKEGVPPYILFTNRQLAEIVRRLPDSPNALSRIEGIGPGKLEQYGDEVLKLLNQAGREASE